jgi:hypothetical protein
VSAEQAPAGDTSVAAYADERAIIEVLHFTTNKGAVGIFSTGAVLSRDSLEREQHVQHIYTPNCDNRLKDADWTGYVNLSISRVNKQMLSTSQGWHSTEDLWWLVLAFDVDLLADQDVYFVTTNNTYTNCLLRGTGVSAMERMFAQSVEWGWYGSRKTRYAGMPDAWTTDPQAEVLYPDRVPLHHLRAAYVYEEEHSDTVRSWFSFYPKVPRVPVVYRPEVFR